MEKRSKGNKGKGEEEEGERGMPILLSKDRDSGWISAQVVPKKGKNTHAVRTLVNNLNGWDTTK